MFIILKTFDSFAILFIYNSGITLSSFWIRRLNNGIDRQSEIQNSYLFLCSMCH